MNHKEFTIDEYEIISTEEIRIEGLRRRATDEADGFFNDTDETEREEKP